MSLGLAFLGQLQGDAGRLPAFFSRGDARAKKAGTTRADWVQRCQFRAFLDPLASSISLEWASVAVRNQKEGFAATVDWYHAAEPAAVAMTMMRRQTTWRLPSDTNRVRVDMA